LTTPLVAARFSRRAVIRVDSIPRPDGFDFGFDSDSIRLRDSTRLAQSRLVRWVGADRSTLSVSMQPPRTPDRSAHRCCWREAGWRMGPIRNYTIFVFNLNLIIRTAPRSTILSRMGNDRYTWVQELSAGSHSRTSSPAHSYARCRCWLQRVQQGRQRRGHSSRAQTFSHPRRSYTSCVTAKAITT
jgi:hypothetical protein